MSSTGKFDDITYESYSENSIVVRGNTRKYKEDLKKLGGKYNGMLKTGDPGWIFTKKSEKDVKAFINNGVRIATEEDSSFKHQIPALPSLEEFALLISMVKNLTTKMENMEKSMDILLKGTGVDKEKSKVETKKVNIKILPDIEIDENEPIDSDDEEAKPVPKRLLRFREK